jgi:hypothetical protein
MVDRFYRLSATLGVVLGRVWKVKLSYECRAPEHLGLAKYAT